MTGLMEGAAFLFLALGSYSCGWAGAAAQSASPYDVTYAVRGGLTGTEVRMRAGPQDGAAIVATLPQGVGGIVMRWCRPEFNFRKWAFGGRGMHRAQLKGKVCEVDWNGRIGFVDGAALEPEE